MLLTLRKNLTRKNSCSQTIIVAICNRQLSMAHYHEHSHHSHTG